MFIINFINYIEYYMVYDILKDTFIAISIEFLYDHICQYTITFKIAFLISINPVNSNLSMICSYFNGGLSKGLDILVNSKL